MPFENWFIFQNDRLLLIQDKLPDNDTAASLKPHFIRRHNLGTFNNIECYCAEIHSDIYLPDMESLPLRKAFDKLGDWYPVIAKAASIINWDKTHQFCGCCGNPTELLAGSLERVCKTCGLSFFPRISPSIIVLICKNDHILMSRGPHFSPGAYGLIAGFVEAGESLENAVHREVREEVSITIKNLRYFGSQAWPFPDSLMIGFIADYESGDIIIDTSEIETAGWYRYDQLPGLPSTHSSIARKLIDYFISLKVQHGSL